MNAEMLSLLGIADLADLAKALIELERVTQIWDINF